MTKRRIALLLIIALILLAGGSALLSRENAPVPPAEGTAALSDTAALSTPAEEVEEFPAEPPVPAGESPVPTEADASSASTAADPPKAETLPPEKTQASQPPAQVSGPPAQGNKTPASAAQTEDTPSETQAPPAEEPAAGSPDTFAGDLLALINEDRAEAGLSPLTLDPALCSVAQLRAGECVTEFGHTRPNGTPYKTAVSDAGISYSHVGENLASGQSTAKEVMESWMGSGSHRDNILSDDFTKVGIGTAENTDPQIGGYAWTLVFTD